MSDEKYALLRTFRSLFEGKPYLHRKSNLGDLVASQLYEDLVAIGKSIKLVEGVQRHERVVNMKNVMTGKPARRGDGTFGELVPAAVAVTEKGMLVARGPVATIEIGAETKILAKAMIKQIDRVINDLVNQVTQFKRGGGNPICVAFVGINFAAQYVSFEGRKRWPTDGKNTNIQSKKPHKPSNGLMRERGQRSTNFRFCVSAPLMQGRSHSNGSISKQRKWNILRF